MWVFLFLGRMWCHHSRHEQLLFAFCHFRKLDTVASIFCSLKRLLRIWKLGKACSKCIRKKKPEFYEQNDCETRFMTLASNWARILCQLLCLSTCGKMARCVWAISHPPFFIWRRRSVSETSICISNELISMEQFSFSNESNCRSVPAQGPWSR